MCERMMRCRVHNLQTPAVIRSAQPEAFGLGEDKQMQGLGGRWQGSFFKAKVSTTRNKYIKFWRLTPSFT